MGGVDTSLWTHRPFEGTSPRCRASWGGQAWATTVAGRRPYPPRCPLPCQTVSRLRPRLVRMPRRSALLPTVNSAASDMAPPLRGAAHETLDESRRARSGRDLDWHQTPVGTWTVHSGECVHDPNDSEIDPIAHLSGGHRPCWVIRNSRSATRIAVARAAPEFAPICSETVVVPPLGVTPVTMTQG